MEHSGTALFRVPYPKFLHILLYKIGAYLVLIKLTKTKREHRKFRINTGIFHALDWEALTKKIPAKNENYGFLNAVNQVKHMTGCVNITGPK